MADNLYLFVLCCVLFMSFSLSAQTTYNVSDEASLDIALASAIDGDIVEFNTGVIIILSSPKSIDDDLTINGNSATINHNGANRIIINNNKTIVINNLTFTGGMITSSSSISGGSIRILQDANVTLNGCSFIGNAISSVENSANMNNFASGQGGAIFAQSSTLTINNCTFSANSVTAIAMNATDNNFANSFGGAVKVDGPTTLAINNCTFSGNFANTIASNAGESNFLSSFGGALFVAANSTLSMANSTFTGNIVSSSSSNSMATYSTLLGGAINTETPATLNLSNNILANSTGPSDIYIADLAGVNVNTNNIVETCIGGSGSCPAFFSSSDPMLGPLANNGGNTQTHALLLGSPAINNGDNASCLTEDQRGFGRNGNCDIGAFEFQGINPNIPPVPIPTLSQWGTILLSLLMLIFGVLSIRQKIIT